jgi:hypothetical protein
MELRPPRAKRTRRWLVVTPGVALLLIVGLVVWKRFQPVSLANRSTERQAALGLERPLPHWALFDQRNQLVRVDRYRGRHALLIQAGGATPRQHAEWRTLDQIAPQFHSADWIVLRVNSCRPAENRPEAGSTDSATTIWLSDLDGRVQAELAAAVDESRSALAVTGSEADAFSRVRWYHVDRRGVIVRTAPGWLNPTMAEEILATR